MKHMEAILEQVLERLETAGFHRSEITEQATVGLASGTESFPVSCRRDYEGTTLQFEGTLTTRNRDEGYQLSELTISEFQVPHWERTPLQLSAQEGDCLDIAFAAYQFLGKFDRLSLQLYMLGLPGRKRQLLTTLPEQAEFTGFCQDITGTADYSIRVLQLPDGYSIQDYEMSYCPYPILQHGSFCGVNTWELEMDMAAIDWSRDGALFTERAQAVLDRLDALRESIPGGYTGHILQLKYMQEASIAEVLIHDEAWETLKRLPVSRAVFPPDIAIDVALNLMGGRAVMQSDEQTPLHQAQCWHRIRQQAKGGPAVFTTVDGYAWETLARHVRLIIPDESKAADTAYLLSRGAIVRVLTYRSGTMYIQADPEQKQLQLLTPDRRPVPFTFNPDPDWNQRSELRHSYKAQMEKKNPFRKQNKGKGI